MTERKKAAASPQPRAKSDKKTKPVGFNVTARRAMNEQLVGEGGPGPGAYVPVSSFGKQAAIDSRSKDKHKLRSRPSSAFSSRSLQRPKPPTGWVPGAVVFSAAAVEKDTTNPGASMKSKQKRLDPATGSEDWAASQTPVAIGPGAYNSHLHKSISERASVSVKSNTRRNPGFGRGAPRRLPFEDQIEEDYKTYAGLPEGELRKRGPEGAK